VAYPETRRVRPCRRAHRQTRRSLGRVRSGVHSGRQVVFVILSAAPAKARYLQLFHNLGRCHDVHQRPEVPGQHPTLVAGLNTRCRFAWSNGNVDGFHTFHSTDIVGSFPPRWPYVPAIQPALKTRRSPIRTRERFGPANSFTFKINQGSFMALSSRRINRRRRDWRVHMHCHVLTHMMDGMMGFLFGDSRVGAFTGLPVASRCPADTGGGGLVVTIRTSSSSQDLMVSAGKPSPWN